MNVIPEVSWKLISRGNVSYEILFISFGIEKKSLNTTYELYIFFYFEGRGGTDGTKHGRFDPEDNGTHGTKGKHGKYKPSKNNYPNKYNGN